MLALDGHKRKAEVSLSTLKRGRIVLKAIVANPVHSADGLIALVVRVLHLYVLTGNYNNLLGCKPGLMKRLFLAKCSVLVTVINHHQVSF